MRLNLWAVFFIFACNVWGQTEVPVHPLVPMDRAGSAVSRSAISKDELMIPSKAIKELQRSQRDYWSGNVRGSVQHLENALRLYPNYVEARNNLGAQYIELREYVKAVAELQKATQIDASIVQPFNNLSVALFLLQRYPEAEATARQALTLDPQNSISQYVLGCTLATENRDTPEALEMLRATKAKFPEARLLFAKILVRHGNVDEAIRELRGYLTGQEIEKRAFAEHWLAQLQGLSDSQKGSVQKRIEQ